METVFFCTFTVHETEINTFECIAYFLTREETEWMNGLDWIKRWAYRQKDEWTDRWTAISMGSYDIVMETVCFIFYNAWNWD